MHPLSGEEGQLIRSRLPIHIPSFPALFREDTTYPWITDYRCNICLETNRILKSKFQLWSQMVLGKLTKGPGQAQRRPSEGRAETQEKPRRGSGRPRGDPGEAQRRPSGAPGEARGGPTGHNPAKMRSRTLLSHFWGVQASNRTKS